MIYTLLRSPSKLSEEELKAVYELNFPYNSVHKESYVYNHFGRSQKGKQVSVKSLFQYQISWKENVLQSYVKLCPQKWVETNSADPGFY
jgi:hypothetical protein